MGEEEAKETSTTGRAEREGRRLVTTRCNSLPVQCPIGVTGHCELQDSPGLGSINQGVPCEAIQLGSSGVAQGSELCHLFLLNSPELLCHTSQSSSVSGVGVGENRSCAQNWCLCSWGAPGNEVLPVKQELREPLMHPHKDYDKWKASPVTTLAQIVTTELSHHKAAHTPQQ